MLLGLGWVVAVLFFYLFCNDKGGHRHFGKGPDVILIVGLPALSRNAVSEGP